MTKGIKYSIAIAALVSTIFVAPQAFAAPSTEVSCYEGLCVASAEVVCNNGWVFDSVTPPSIEVKLTSQGVSQGTIKVNVRRDTKEQLLEIERAYQIERGEQIIKIALDLDPGFYIVDVAHNGQYISHFNIGYEPTRIISEVDSQSDFEAFWQAAIDELATVAPKYKMVKIKEKSTQYRDLYLVSMRSLDGALVQGHVAIPTDKSKRYPAYINYMGYGADPWIPGTDYATDRIDFVVSVRGQGLNKPTNSYGDWIVWGLSSREEYYYRGAFMDLIRAVDFIEQLPQCDARNIFADGASQGGAFTLVAASLDHRFAAVAPAVPFLSDYPDYFRIVDWPGNAIIPAQWRLEISDEELYTTLSYFDVKNFTHMIACPVIMYAGLQDPVCPPHTNFAGYNHITTHKEYYVAPTGTHDVEQEVWNPQRDAFFEIFTTK
ncbi:MAG: acetylxylan esterase [Rikenellaceae bacterium]